MKRLSSQGSLAPTRGPKSKIATGTPSINLSGRQTPKSMKTSIRAIEKGNFIRVEPKEINDAKEEFVDPEAAHVGNAKRPMTLTHSVMVGLTLILLISLEAILISKVSNQCNNIEKLRS